MPGQRNYDNTNKLSLFPSDRQRDGHKDPDLSGYINIDGVEYWLNAWTYYNDDDTVRVISGVIGDRRESQPESRKPAPKGKSGAKSGRR